MMVNILTIAYSALMRRKLCDIINSDKDFHVADVSASGDDAYNKIMSNSYDLVVMDMTMPNVHGIRLLKKLSEQGKSVPLVAIITDLKEDREVMVHAMELGALEFISSKGQINLDHGDFAQRLLEVMHRGVADSAKAGGIGAGSSVKERQSAGETSSAFIKSVVANTDRTREILSSFTRRSVKENTSHREEVNREVTAPKKEPVPQPSGKRSNGKKLIALACSTGGPQALSVMIPMLPKNLSAPLVLVQHMPVGFTEPLAMRLTQCSQVNVKEAAEGDILQPGWVYIAPGGKHMKIRENQNDQAYVHISDDPPINSLRPCADVMYESLQNSGFDEIICVVLTGMGADGTKGITTLKKHKRIYCISESEETCVVYGMPKSVVTRKLSDEVVPINKVAEAIVKRLGG